MNRSGRSHWTVALAFVVSQVLAVLGWVVATVVTRRVVPGAARPDPYHGFLGWTSWDGGFYRLIVDHGYEASSESIRFFPLYPLVTKPVSVLLGGNTDLALFVVAKVALVAALFGIHRLVVDHTGSLAIAERSVWIWVLFPGAFVFAWAYSEPLLVALAAWGLVALRRGRWWTAALLGLAVGLCRPVGIAFAAAALIEVVARYRAGDRGPLPGRAAAILAAPAGLVAFCGYSAWRGFGFLTPFTIQDEFRDTQTPLHRLWSLPDTFSGSDAFTAGLHVPFVVGFLILLGIAFWKLPASWAWFSAVVLAAALSADNLNSIERYATSAFPLAVVVAILLEGRERLTPAVYALGGACSVAFCALALLGAYVP